MAHIQQQPTCYLVTKITSFSLTLVVTIGLADSVVGWIRTFIYPARKRPEHEAQGGKEPVNS
jgi:hypothetical protein